MSSDSASLAPPAPTSQIHRTLSTSAAFPANGHSDVKRIAISGGPGSCFLVAVCCTKCTRCWLLSCFLFFLFFSFLFESAARLVRRLVCTTSPVCLWPSGWWRRKTFIVHYCMLFVCRKLYILINKILISPTTCAWLFSWFCRCRLA